MNKPSEANKKFKKFSIFYFMDLSIKNGSLYLSQKIMVFGLYFLCVIYCLFLCSVIFCFLSLRRFYDVHDNIDAFFLLQKDFDTFHEHINTFLFLFFFRKILIPFTGFFLKVFFKYKIYI